MLITTPPLASFLGYWSTNRSPVHILHVEGPTIYAGILVSAFAGPNSIYFVVCWKAVRERAATAWALTTKGPVTILELSSCRLTEYDGCYIFKDVRATVIADLHPEHRAQFGFKSATKTAQLVRPPFVPNEHKQAFVSWARQLRPQAA